MDLRRELTPPELDESLVARLAELAASIDGASPGEWEDNLAEFNRLAGTPIPSKEFQGIYGGEGHEDFVRRVLRRRKLTEDPNLSTAEMAEIISRIIAGGKHCNFYVELFRANCRHPSGTDLIFWPNLVSELSQNRDPSNQEIANLALRGKGLE